MIFYGLLIEITPLDRKKQKELLKNSNYGERTSDQSLNQEIWLKKALCISSELQLFPSIIYVIQIIMKGGSSGEKEKYYLTFFQNMHISEFAFFLHFMKYVFKKKVNYHKHYRERSRHYKSDGLSKTFKQPLSDSTNDGWEPFTTDVMW